jgi:hypothetical protein
MWFRRGELLRGCCVNPRGPYRIQGAVGTAFVSPKVGPLTLLGR